MSRKNRCGKILLVGGLSRLGLRVREAAVKRGISITAISRSPGGKGLRTGDIRKKNEMKKILEEERPDTVVHAAALTDVDLCEKEKELAWATNVTGSENVAEACREAGCRLIYVSTDYVFDGSEGPYSESCLPSPINYYGLTKWEGEKRVQAIHKNTLILRTCVPYDWNPGAKSNFLMWLVGKLEACARVRIVTDQFSTPTYIPELAQSLLLLAQMDICGVLHVAGREFLNRYEFARKVCASFHLDESLVEPCLSDEIAQPAPRPLKGGLRVEKAEKLLHHKLLTLSEGLRRAKDQRYP